MSEQGLYTKYDLIDSMIVGLNCVNVSGVENMKIIIETIQKLGALKEGLKKEEEQRADNHDEQRENV